MLSKLTLETKAKEIVNGPVFQQYMRAAKSDDNFRRLRAPRLTMQVPNSTQQESLIVELSQDSKHINLKEESNGIVHLVGFYPLSFFQKTKPMAKKAEPTKKKATKAKKTTKAKISNTKSTRKRTTKRTTTKRTIQKKTK